MQATKTLTPPRSTKSPSARVELVRDLPATQGTDPEFDRLRQLHAIVRSKAGPHLEAVVAEADEIARLRERFDRGQGGNRGGNQYGKFTGVNLPPSGGGFVAKLQAELGLHPEQARRIEARADYVSRLRLAAMGQPVKYLTGTGKAKHEETFQPDDQAAKMARTALGAVMAGDVPPSRAWAGVVGEGKRRLAQGGEAKRKEVQPGKKIRDALHSLAKWMPAYKKLPMNERSILAQTAKKLDLDALLSPLWNDIAQVEVES